MTAAAPAPDSSMTSPTPTGPLSQLIQEALDSGKSLRDLGKIAVDPETGEHISWQYFQKLIKNPPASAPNPLQMRAIAAALSKPYRRIQEATAKQWLQYEATELAGYGDEMRIIVAHLSGQPESEKRRWRMMIEAAEKAQREADE